MYHFHGVLCDDMGLGKTLQTLIIILSSHHLDNEENFPSLVVCPSTIVRQWEYEINKFFRTTDLNCLLYMGSITKRKILHKEIGKVNKQIVLSTYNIITRESSLFKKQRWNYCVLDEGHLIKNSNSIKAKVLKSLFSKHRLILSGTPIQNNTLDIWSSFDFLMPGYLGSRKEFQKIYCKSIHVSKSRKLFWRRKKENLPALDLLHKKILPFIMRRNKEEVLKDLPSKVIQDFYVDLSSIQKKIYEMFMTIELKKIIIGYNKNRNMRGNLFKALHFMRKLCTHPVLIINDKYPFNKSLASLLKKNKKKLEDSFVSLKFEALKQILFDSRINKRANHQRFLIFCQFKSTLDLISSFLIKFFPLTEFRIIHGGMSERSKFISSLEFNKDKKIDILILTSKAGSLGLNLISANTVVFMEHDWNPFFDIQAMDRCHRIGQKKKVHVYRIITKGTIEDKIVGLKSWKQYISKQIISKENNEEISYVVKTNIVDLFKLETQIKVKNRF